MMPTVIAMPTPYRPDTGRAPRSEAQRPALPQHARFCPVLEDGSALGLLVFPPLAPGESFQMRYLPDNRFLFSFFVGTLPYPPERLFSTLHTFSANRASVWTEELVYKNPAFELDDEAAFGLRRAVVNADTLGTPAGGVGLRGATNFVTPPRWDTVYTGVFNLTEPPALPVLTVRVQTDWFPHDSEFRYILQPGDSVGATATTPIGQVLFVPREELPVRDATAEEVASFLATRDQFNVDKSNDQRITGYGAPYSTLYSKRRRERA